MRSGVMVREPAVEKLTRSERLQRFLQAYWLRPENAFWMTIRSETLATEFIESPSLDLCCGDGVFSFLHLGGLFEPDFDVFLGADADAVRAAPGGDMFDHVDDAYLPRIARDPLWYYDVAADHKSSLLAKAARLNFYGLHVQCDANKALPFEDGAFKTIYCNSAYWIRNIDGLLKELRRVTAEEGRIILHVKLDSFHTYSLNRFAAALGDRFLARINGGRLANWPTLGSDAAWRQRFERAGLAVVGRIPFITATHVHIWEVGLRPIAPMLVKMTRALRPGTRAAIKLEWVELFMDLCAPLCDPAIDLVDGDQPAEVQYVLTRP